jgi:hypothetical protein
MLSVGSYTDVYVNAANVTAKNTRAAKLADDRQRLCSMFPVRLKLIVLSRGAMRHGRCYMSESARSMIGRHCSRVHCWQRLQLASKRPQQLPPYLSRPLVRSRKIVALCRERCDRMVKSPINPLPLRARLHFHFRSPADHANRYADAGTATIDRVGQADTTFQFLD